MPLLTLSREFGRGWLRFKGATENPEEPEEGLLVAVLWRSALQLPKLASAAHSTL